VTNNGTVFKIDEDGSNFAVIHYFTGGTNDGSGPSASLVAGPSGALYGTTLWGGLYNQGIIFRVDYEGSNYTVLYNFGSVTNDGKSPSNLVQGPDGALYGTAFFGGTSNLGTFYRLNADGSGYAVALRFAGTNGENPNPLILASDGAFYGTCNAGGPLANETVFRLTGLVLDMLAAPVKLPGGGWQVSGHGATGVNYTLLSTTNLSLLASQWIALGTVTTGSSGNWQFNDPTNLPQRFYQTSYP
jgi:uncharacterized repeat protein (TIGR03803 family)